MKDLSRIACVLIAGLLAGCGGIGSGAGGEAAGAAPETRLVLDNTAWDQTDWAE